MEATSNSVMQFNVFLKLSEGEARALEALTGYGHKAFLKYFYEHLGTSYLQPHEKGLISLFDSIKREIPAHLSRIDKTIEAFENEAPRTLTDASKYGK